MTNKEPRVLRPDGEAALELLREGRLDAAVASGEVVLEGNDPGQRPPAGAGFEPATEADLKEHAERQAAVERARQPRPEAFGLTVSDHQGGGRWWGIYCPPSTTKAINNLPMATCGRAIQTLYRKFDTRQEAVDATWRLAAVLASSDPWEGEPSHPSASVEIARRLVARKNEHAALREELSQSNPEVVEAVDQALMRQVVREVERERHADGPICEHPARPVKTCKSTPLPQDVGTSLETETSWPSDRWDSEGRQMTYKGDGNWQTVFGPDTRTYKLRVDGSFDPVFDPEGECGVPVGDYKDKSLDWHRGQSAGWNRQDFHDKPEHLKDRDAPGRVDWEAGYDVGRVERAHAEGHRAAWTEDDDAQPPLGLQTAAAWWKGYREGTQKLLRRLNDQIAWHHNNKVETFLHGEDNL